MRKLTCPNKNHPEWKELEKELPNMAYVIWDANNGYGIDKAPNGGPSKLFSDLLEHYNGDRSKAIQAKSKIYTDGFKMWFNNGVVDTNNEPLITDGKLTNGNGKTLAIDTDSVNVFRKLTDEIEKARNVESLAKASKLYTDILGDNKYEPKNAGELIDRLLLKGYYKDNNNLLELINSLKQTAYSVPIKFAFELSGGMAYTTRHDIVIDASSLASSGRWFEEAIAHELIHHVTLEAYQRPKTDLERELKASVDDMYNAYKSKLKSKAELENDLYGFNDPEEFIAELLTNNRMLLSARVAYSVKDKIKYLFDKFIKKLVRLIKASDSTVKQSEHIKDIVKKLIEDSNSGNIRLWQGNNGMTDVRKNIESPLVKEYQKNVKLIAAKIEQGIKTRIKALQQYGKITDSQVRKLESELAKLQDLFEKNEDKAAMLEFIEHISKETVRPIKSINKAFDEFSETGTFSLRNDQLVQLQKDLIGFYEPILKDINEKLAIPGYFDDMDDVHKEFIDNQIMLINRAFDILNSKYKQLLAHRFGEILIQYGDASNSPTIRQYVEDNTNTTSFDLGFYHSFIGSIKFVKDEALRLIHRKVVDTENEIQRITTEKASNFLPIAKKVKNWQPLYEVDSDGKKTGYLVRDLNYGMFKRNYQTFMEELGDAPIGDPDKLKEYYRLKNDWLAKHAERRYTPEYYNLFNELSESARVARDNIQSEISDILIEYTDKSGNINLEQMPDDQWSKLESLYQQKRMLSNSYYWDGTIKEGIDKDIAKQLKHVNEVLNENIKYSTDDKKFNAIFNNKVKTLAPELYEKLNGSNIETVLIPGYGLLFDKEHAEYATYITPSLRKWFDRNTKLSYTQELYDTLEGLERRYYGEEYDSLQEEKKELMRLYRRSNDMQVNANIMPDSVKDRIKELDRRMNDIVVNNKSNNKSKSEISKLITMEKSVFYKAQKDAALKQDKTTPGFYAKWQSDNHYIDASGTLRPYSYLTFMLPVNRKHIKIVPSQAYSEIDPSSKYYNANFNPENSESYQPKRSLYDNKEAYDKILADKDMEELHSTIRNVIRETNSKITFMKRHDEYRLPQISGSMWAHISSTDNIAKGFFNYIKDSVTIKNDDTEYNYDNNNTRPDGSRLSTIPTHYIKMLDNPAAITNNLAGAVMEYFKMGENFRQKQSIIPELELLQQQIDRREYQPNMVSSSKLVQGIAEGIDDLRRSRILPKQKQATNTSNRLDKFYNMNIFGEKHVPISLGNWNITKTLNKFKNYATIVNLGLNLGVAAAGLTTSFHQHLTESITGVYYTPKVAALAFAECVKNYAKIMTGWGNYTASNKLLGLMNYNQVSRSNSESFKRLNYNRTARFIMNHLWYGGMSFGDFFTKSQILTSVYMNTKFVEGKGFISRDEFIRESRDKKVSKKAFDNLSTPSLYDIYEHSGTTVKVKDEYKQYEKYLTDEFLNKTRNIVNYLCQRADGMIDETDKNRIHANVLTGFTIMHKSYILSALEDRVLKPKQWNYLLERYDEGTYRTVTRVMVEGAKYLWNMSAYGLGKRETKPETRKLENFERYNVARVGSEIGLLIAYVILSTLIGSWREEDKNDWAKSYMYYVSERTVYEVGNLYNPWDVINSFKTISPAMGTLENWKTLGSILEFWNWQENFDKTTKYGPYKGQNKFEKTMWKVTPFKNVIEASDPNQKLKYLQGQLQ